MSTCCNHCVLTAFSAGIRITLWGGPLCVMCTVMELVKRVARARTVGGRGLLACRGSSQGADYARA